MARELKDLFDLSRNPFKSQWRSIKDSILNRTPKYNMHGLTTENKLTWFFKNLGHLGNTHYQYQKYNNPQINNGIFKMPDNPEQEISIALLSDWASDTFESRNIALMAAENDYSIHLGDTYYVGNSQEIANNFNTAFGGPWPYGTLGSFAILGNHEMYSSGKSYFTQLLPYMGTYAGNILQQEASFFCLENDHWRIIGLDTGYDSLKGCLGIKANTNLKLHEWQMEWLRETIKPDKDKRGIILLSHHQYFSAFANEDEHPNPANQLAPLLGSDRTVLWWWAHEHRFSLYGSNPLPGGAKVFPRCIGNSGMPIEMRPTRSPDPLNSLNRNLVLFDKRIKTTVGKTELGYNGFVILKLKGPTLIAEYYDDNDDNDDNKSRLIFSEKWSVDNNSGKLTGIEITDFTQTSSKKLSVFADNIKQAIGYDRNGNPIP
ncbi:MAG: metallophosphoesterase [Bacteroidia bacterium]